MTFLTQQKHGIYIDLLIETLPPFFFKEEWQRNGFSPSRRCHYQTGMYQPTDFTRISTLPVSYSSMQDISMRELIKKESFSLNMCPDNSGLSNRTVALVYSLSIQRNPNLFPQKMRPTFQKRYVLPVFVAYKGYTHTQIHLIQMLIRHHCQPVQTPTYAVFVVFVKDCFWLVLQTQFCTTLLITCFLQNKSKNIGE